MSVSAQTADTSIFRRIVDYLDCRLVKYSLEGSKEQGAIDNYNKNCHCDQEPNFNLIQSSIGDKIKKTQNLSKAINSAKNKFNPSWKIEDVVLYLKDSLLKCNQELKSFNDTHKGEAGYNEILNSIDGEYRKHIPTQSSNTQPAALPSEQSQVEPIVPTQSNSVFTIPVIVLIVVVSILVIIIIVIIRAISSKETPEYIKEYIRVKIKEVNKQSGGSNSNVNSNSILHDVNRTLDNKLNEYSSAIAKMQKELLELQSNDKSTYQNRNMANAPVHNVSSNEIFYLSTPNNDGSFNDNDMTSGYEEGGSLYRFEKLSSNRAKFAIENRSDAIERALQYPERQITPVCEADNSPRNAKGIKTISQGEVELDGNKWKVNKKSKIRYE